MGAQIVEEDLLYDGLADGRRLQAKGGGPLCSQCGEAACGQEPAQNHDHCQQDG